MRLTYRDEKGVPHWISGLLDIEHDDIRKFLRMTIADYEDELERKKSIHERCKNCDYWNTWDRASNEDLKNYVCSCALWTNKDSCTYYTNPDDFCSYFEPREEEAP